MDGWKRNVSSVPHHFYLFTLSCSKVEQFLQVEFMYFCFALSVCQILTSYSFVNLFEGYQWKKTTPKLVDSIKKRIALLGLKYKKKFVQGFLQPPLPKNIVFLWAALVALGLETDGLFHSLIACFNLREPPHFLLPARFSDIEQTYALIFLIKLINCFTWVSCISAHPQ